MPCERFLRNKRKRISKCKKYAISIILIVAAVLIGIEMWYIKRAVPIIKSFGISNVQSLVVNKTNEIVAQVMKDENIGYNDIVKLTTNNNGDVISIETNIANTNYIMALITKQVNEAIDGTNICVKLRLGSLIDDISMGNLGPLCTFMPLANTSLYPKLENNFTSAGVNQTRHQILLKFTVPIDVSMPQKEDDDVVTFSVLIAETIIVGNVPHLYAIR